MQGVDKGDGGSPYNYTQTLILATARFKIFEAKLHPGQPGTALLIVAVTEAEPEFLMSLATAVILKFSFPHFVVSNTLTSLAVCRLVIVEVANLLQVSVVQARQFPALFSTFTFV